MADKRWKQPRRLYNAQKSKALARNIAWELTFEQWWGIWQDSGKWNKRGKRSGQFVMSRKGDVGPYSVDNIIIKESGENNREGMSGWHERKQLLANVEKLEQVIPVEEFKAKEKVFKEILEKNNSSTKQRDPWTIAKVICLAFPVWGPRWFAPNK